MTDTNNGRGFFLVSNHGPDPYAFVLVVSVTAANSWDGKLWQIPSPICRDYDGDGYGWPAFPSCPHTEPDCDDGDPARNPGVVEGPYGDPLCGNGVDDDCDGLVDGEDPGCVE